MGGISMEVVSWWNLRGGNPRGPGGSREYLGRGPAPGSGWCFNCGIDGHWARDCKAGDWKNRCYRCGEKGHIERSCPNSPKNLSRHGQSYSRSSPRRGRGWSRSYSCGRSYSRSRSISPDYSRSPKSRKSPTPERKHSLSPDGGSRRPREQGNPSPEGRREAERNGSDYSGCPRRGNSQSSVSPERESSPVGASP